MNFEYCKIKDAFLCNYEQNFLKKYEELFYKYDLIINQFGFTLNYGLFWKNYIYRKESLKRISRKNGYTCYLYCSVQKNGKDIKIPSEDGEVEFYYLSETWILTSISRLFLRLYANIYDDPVDVEQVLKTFVVHLRNTDQLC